MRIAREASESRAGFSRTVLRAGNSYCLGSRPWAANKPMSAWKRLAVTALAWRWRCSRRVTSSALSTRPRSVISPAPSSVATRPTRSMPHLIREYAELFKPEPWAPPSPPMRRLCELQTVRAGIVSNRAEWNNRIGGGLGDSTATRLAAATIEHFTSQLEAIDREEQYRREWAEINQALTDNSMAVTRAMSRWYPRPGERERHTERVMTRFEDGSFLLNRLGAEAVIDQDPTIRGLTVEQYLTHLREGLLPLSERCGRVIREALASLEVFGAAPSRAVERSRPVPISVVFER